MTPDLYKKVASKVASQVASQVASKVASHKGASLKEASIILKKMHKNLPTHLSQLSWTVKSIADENTKKKYFFKIKSFPHHPHTIFTSQEGVFEDKT